MNISRTNLIEICNHFLQVDGAESIKGIVFGRFDNSCGLNVEVITDIIRDKVPCNIPVIIGADFGHVFPMITFPVGGTARIIADNSKAEIQFLIH